MPSDATRAGIVAELTLIYWRDIPAQVIVMRGREVAMRPLLERFEVAMAKTAMRAELRDSDAYLAEWWRTETVSCGDDLEPEASAAAVRFEAEYDEEQLLHMIASRGKT